jgi:beta-lactamase class A
VIRHCATFVSLVLLLGGCATAPPAPAPASGASLEDTLRARLVGFRGRVGVYVRHLTSGEEVAIAADDVFPTASTIKAPILAALLARVAAGELDWHQDLVYERARRYPGEDLLGAFADGEKVALGKVAMLSITTSDNTAALWCQELAGGGGRINDWLLAQGFTTTRVNSRTPGREADRERFGWGQTTPREMARFFTLVRDRLLVDAAASEELHRCLSRVYWDGEALSAIPPEVQVISKQGAVSQSRSEVLLVHAPHGDYVCCVITADQADTSWQPDNEGYVLLRDVSALLWRHFEPDWPYAPPPGSERYR